MQRALGDDSPELAARTAFALHRAGERALSLNAFGAAGRYFVAELELRPDDDPERPSALLGLGWARAHSEGGGTTELTDAFNALCAADRLEEAAEVAAELAAIFWSSGEPEQADEYAARADALAADLPPVRSKAVALSRLASYRSVRDQAEEAIRDGSAALELAESLGLDDVRARALTALGNARTQSGDRAALQDFERSIALAVAHRSTHAVTAYINYAGSQIAFGNLAEAFRLQAAGRTIAAELGEERLGAWLYAEQIMECYWTGRWDEAIQLAEEVSSATVAAMSYMEVPARITHGLIELDRGEPAAAAGQAERALERALEIGDVQVVLPAHAFRARVFLAEGGEQEARDLVESALAQLPGKEVWASYSWAALGFLLDALGLPGSGDGGASTPGSTRAGCSSRRARAGGRALRGDRGAPGGGARPGSGPPGSWSQPGSATKPRRSSKPRLPSTARFEPRRASTKQRRCFSLKTVACDADQEAVPALPVRASTSSSA